MEYAKRHIQWHDDNIHVRGGACTILQNAADIHVYIGIFMAESTSAQVPVGCTCCPTEGLSAWLVGYRRSPTQETSAQVPVGCACCPTEGLSTILVTVMPWRRIK